MSEIIAAFTANTRTFTLTKYESSYEVLDSSQELVLCFTKKNDSYIVSLTDRDIGHITNEGAWVYYQRPIQTRHIFDNNLIDALTQTAAIEITAKQKLQIPTQMSIFHPNA